MEAYILDHFYHKDAVCMMQYCQLPVVK